MVDEGNQDGAREERQRSRRARPGAAKSLWKRIRVHIVRSPVTTAILARLIHAWLRLVWTTNRPVSGSDSVIDRIARGERGIGAAWHGQHLMFPCIMPGGHTGAVMVSRSADAELNARVLELAGIDTLRGSGGRANDRKAAERGGARALIGLKRVLDEGKWVGMIADIPHGTPRDAGMGIVTLARISGKPVYPVAYQTSRRKVLERTWDKTTINWPFGRAAIVVGDPIHVAADADEAAMEAARLHLTAELDRASARAAAMVDGNA